MWYCRFYLGRRSRDDDRQIGRWKNCTGPKGIMLKKILSCPINWDTHGSMEISSNELIGTDGNLKKKIGGPFWSCQLNITANIFLLQYIVELLPVIFWGVRNNWYQSYNSTVIEIGAQFPQSGPIAWPNVYQAL